MATRFYAALAHTGTLAFFDGKGERRRVSNTNLLPPKIRDSLLFSLSFPAKVHHTTGGVDLDADAVLPDSFRPRKTTHMFADCGAYQFREETVPRLSDGTLLNSEVAWRRYDEEHHLDDERWEQVLLCAPDHMLIEGLSDDEVQSRIAFNTREAAAFIHSFPPHLDSNVVVPVGVIHGRDVAERKLNLDRLIDLGYEYVALGGMVPFSTKPAIALDIVAGLGLNAPSPSVAPDSILGRCREKGVRLHVFGLNSPEWMRWWIRLGVDSFDGSKLSTEGARNGWYWIPMDGTHGRPHHRSLEPTSAGDLYSRINVKKIGLTDAPHRWAWLDRRWRPAEHFVTDGGHSTACDCDACRYLRQARCTSDRCWGKHVWADEFHVPDPRCMGSTEHNMGRMAHNAHVYDWLKQEMETYVEEADHLEKLGALDADSFLRHWISL